MQNKAKLIVSLSSLVLSGFFIKPLYDSWSGRNDYEYHSQSQKEIQYQQRDTKNPVENGDFSQTENGKQSLDRKQS